MMRMEKEFKKAGSPDWFSCFAASFKPQISST